VVTVFRMLRAEPAVERTSTVETLTGARPRPLAGWARNHAVALGCVTRPESGYLDSLPTGELRWVTGISATR
jgi:hypothetical protein